MKRKQKKDWQWLLMAAAMGALLGTVAHYAKIGTVLRLPVAFGAWLQKLSLSGMSENFAAWAIVLAISALPLLGLLRAKRTKVDLLLFLASAELLVAQYFLVNPTLLYPQAERDIAPLWGLISLSTAIGTLLAWLFLRLLTKLECKPDRILPKLLYWAAALCAAFVAFTAIQELFARMAKVAAGNTDANRVGLSNVLLCILCVAQMLPRLLGAWVILWGGDLALALDEAPFEETTVALAETIAQRCASVAKASVLIAVGGNLLQLLAFSKVAAIHVTVELPLLTLALSAVLLLLCRYFRRAKAVNDDNATII